MILDGWGLGTNPNVSAIDKANTPYIDSLYHDYPNSKLVTYGSGVGLPEGQMGNSEVGHMNLGAGRIVYQDFAKINLDIQNGDFNRKQNLIKNKELGEVHSVVCRFGIPTLDEPGFRNSAELCGGALWDIASYPVAAVLELFYDQNVQVLFSEVRKHEYFPVDTTGRAILRFSQGTTAYLEWGVGVGYKNEIDLWTDKGSFFTEKIFSKPENYQPVYRVRNKYGEESLVDGQKSEQFIQMFREFLNISKSSKRIKDEHQRILERARVMDEIVKFSI